jgi:hypothetical protein
MGLLIRTLLSWLLVLAVPAQGAAAATMAFCGPDHHGGAPAIHSHEGTAAAPAPHHHGEAASGHAGTGKHTMPAQAHDDGSASGPAATATQLPDVDQQKCSACASCCSVGAIVSTVVTIAVPAGSPTVFDAVVPTVDPFAVGGPDRPPRIVLV